ncbi:MAG: DUF1566 domain-containing protein [Desulfobacteraceae bacterium]|nr:DUF1566 domain-containing protein [Desulfobacteraceae bacterium]
METPEAGQNIITRGLPKTGQTTVHAAFDDGYYQAGWWRGRISINNRERWIAKTIGGDDIVVDRATGLMWAADGNAAGCNNGAIITWPIAITYASTLNFAGFEDWRLPNVFELTSILRLEGAAPLIEQPPFSNTKSGNYWSSTTFVSDALKALYVNFQLGYGYVADKTTTQYLRAVRGGL